MARISFDNGQHFFDADEVVWIDGKAYEPRRDPDPEIEIGWTLDQMAQRMDDATRERVHTDNAPCTDAEFLAAYLAAAPVDLIL